MTGELHIRLRARTASLTELDQAIEGFAAEQEWPSSVLFQSRLVIEELATNIISHGFRGMGGDHEFDVRIWSTPDAVKFELTDDSWPFNPLTDSPDPTLEGDLDDRPVGGLGLHFMQSMMDEIRYVREDGKNRLTVVKRRAE